MENPKPAPCMNRPKSIIQTNWAPAKSAYPSASEKQVPKIEVHFRPMQSAHLPAIRLPKSIPNEAILTAKKDRVGKFSTYFCSNQGELLRAAYVVPSYMQRQVIWPLRQRLQILIWDWENRWGKLRVTLSKTTVNWESEATKATCKITKPLFIIFGKLENFI